MRVLRCILFTLILVVSNACAPQVQLEPGEGRGLLQLEPDRVTFSIFGGAEEATLLLTGVDLWAPCPSVEGSVVEARACLIKPVSSEPHHIEYSGSDVRARLMWCEPGVCYDLAVP